METNSEIIELKAHNGNIIKINTSEKECKNFSGFCHGELIIRNNELAVAMGTGENIFSLQKEFWLMKLGNLGITSSDPKKWHKASAEEIVEFFKNFKKPEIINIDYMDAPLAQQAIA